MSLMTQGKAFFWLPYHGYAKGKKEEGKKRKKRGKKERIQNFLDVGLSFMLLSTCLSMRPGIATDTFLWPLFLGNVVHPPGSNHKDSAPNGSNQKRRRPQWIEPKRQCPQWRIQPQQMTPPMDQTAKTKDRTAKTVPPRIEPKKMAPPKD
jgi:hypothetical protein